MQTPYILALAALLAVGYQLKDNLPTYILTSPTHLPTAQASHPATNDDIDSFMTHTVSLNTTNQGKPKLILHAQTTHRLSNGKIIFKSPYITVYNTVNKPPWHISAGYGYMKQGSHILHLKTQVKLSQSRGKSSSIKRNLTTTELLIFIKRRYAITDKPVTIMEPDSELHAVGLRANFATDKIELLSQVRAQTKV